MNKIYTRKDLQNYNIFEVQRKEAIDKSIEHITSIILKAASGIPAPPDFANEWKRLTSHKIAIQENILNRYRSISHPTHIGTSYTFKDLLSEIIQGLKIVFPDTIFRLDELGSYIIVDWSE